MDAAEFAEIGAKIVKHGVELEKLRSERDALNSQIQILEKELLPLLARHSELIAAMMGRPITPVAAPTPTAVSVTSASGVPLANTLGEAAMVPQVDRKILRRRIQKLMEEADDAMSAMDIAERLKIDAVLVREIMLEMRNG